MNNNQVYTKTDFTNAEFSNKQVTETQKKQLVFLDKMNALEARRGGWNYRYMLTCNTCRTQDMHSCAGVVQDSIERWHAGHATWVNKVS